MADILRCGEKCGRHEKCDRYNGVENKLWDMLLACKLHDLFIEKRIELEVKDER